PRRAAARRHRSRARLARGDGLRPPPARGCAPGLVRPAPPRGRDGVRVHLHDRRRRRTPRAARPARGRGGAVSENVQEEALAEARAALSCVPQTRSRILWEADPGNTRAFLAAMQRYTDAGGLLREFARAVGIVPG